jgi:hypothetical protein
VKAAGTLFTAKILSFGKKYWTKPIYPAFFSSLARACGGVVPRSARPSKRCGDTRDATGLMVHLM